MKIRQRSSSWLSNFPNEFAVVILGGLVILLIGVLGYFPGPIPYIPYVTKIYLDVRSELIGIGLTVIVIDIVRILLQTREKKKNLILQMGSPDNGFAREAVRQLRVKGLLTDGSLEGIYLDNANLQNAVLPRANLRFANMQGANLSEAYMREANLEAAYLYEAILQGTNLGGANLSNAVLTEAYMRNAILIKTNLSGADLLDANLRETYLIKANLSNARLVHANLTDAILLEANLREANLHKADLTGANLRKADLRRAILSHAILEGAAVTSEQLAETHSCEGATMPDGTVYNPETFKESLEKQEPPEQP